MLLLFKHKIWVMTMIIIQGSNPPFATPVPSEKSGAKSIVTFKKVEQKV
jgi:hypothetical protein